MHSSIFSGDFLAHLLSGPAGQPGSLGFIQILTAIALAYGGGILASLTPCVYPMIPITIGVIGGGSLGQKERAWTPVLMRSASYIFGMSVVYSFLGVLAGITGKVFGSFTNTSGWYLGLGLVISLAALIMLDVVPFDPMETWQKLKWRMGRKSKLKSPDPSTVRLEKDEMTLLGAFLLGASSGFIAAPCTTPVLTSILAFIAKTQSIGLGMLLMFAFALGLGTLLLIVAIFTGALQILPRSGTWMKRVKTASGLILLAFADYLIYQAGMRGGL